MVATLISDSQLRFSVVEPLVMERERIRTRMTVRRLSAPHDYRVELKKDVKNGMTAQPKWFPTKYLYDKEGAALFDQFAKQPHYYLYRAETEILVERAQDIMQLVSPDELVELGSGASTKTRLFMDAMRRVGCRRYVPLDISEPIIRRAAANLTADYDWLQVDGQVGDFESDLPKLTRNGRRLMVFLGNTVGNFRTCTERLTFLKKLSAALTEGDALLLGIDLMKDVGDIVAGYFDPDGIGQKFIWRALDIMECELNADFHREHFASGVFWNPHLSALEIRLFAQQDTVLSVRDIQLDVAFSAGEELILGFSTKFSREGITQELGDAGLSVTGWYTDSAERYAVLVAIPHSHS